MRRILYFLLSTVSAIVLLFSYRTSTAAVAPSAGTVVVAAPTAGSTTTGSGSTSDQDSSDQDSTDQDGAVAGQAPQITAEAAPSTGPTDGSTAAANASGLVDGTWTGAAADTRYGPVQVQITVAGGQVTAATAVDYPDSDRKDKQINDRAIPVLNSEALSAQSSSLDTVSGATYTSDGYRTSLQSALDQATS